MKNPKAVPNNPEKEKQRLPQPIAPALRPLVKDYCTRISSKLMDAADALERRQAK